MASPDSSSSDSPRLVLAGGSVVGGIGERLPWKVSAQGGLLPLMGTIVMVYFCVFSPQESKLHQSHEKVSDSHLLFRGLIQTLGFQHTPSQ